MKIIDFPCFFLEFLAKTSIFEVPRPRRSFLPSESSWNLFLTDFVTKTSFFLQKSNQKTHENMIFHHQISKTSLWPPSESIDLEISHLLVVWIPLYDQIWPIWWRKRVKNLSKWRFPTVSDSCRGFTECFRWFPRIPEGLRRCPKVPRLCPLRCIHVKKKVITAWREKWWLMSADYWLIIDHWWLMINNWWLMTDDWWLMIDDWYNMKWTPYCLPQGGTPPGVSYILHFILYQSSIISHQSSVINHQLLIINHQWSMINQ